MLILSKSCSVLILENSNLSFKASGEMIKVWRCCCWDLSVLVLVLSGLLLYAKTDEMILPCKKYKIDGNIISVQTLNLDCEFDEIRVQLNKIIEQYFGFD